MSSIAIDGPSGAGKSSVSVLVAKKLGLEHLDSGAMYRAVGLYALRRGVDPEDGEAVTAMAAQVPLTLAFDNGQRVLLDGEDVTDELPKYSQAASNVSKLPAVRALVDGVLRRIARERGAVVDGRDIGAAVLPDAQLKIYLTADPRVRARRRFLELTEKGIPAEEEQVYADMLARDYQDTHRAVSPLRKAPDAVEVDCSHMSKEQVVAEILRLAGRAGI